MSEVRRDWSGIIGAVIFVVIGAVALWDTARYSDPDSAVFPQTVGTAMIVLSLIYIVWAFIRPSPGEPSTPGSVPRRVALVAIMIAAALAMPLIGFVAAGILAFIALTIAAMHDPWSGRTIVIFPLVGVALVCGFYALFRYGFLVPLPQASLF